MDARFLFKIVSLSLVLLWGSGLVSCRTALQIPANADARFMRVLKRLPATASPAMIQTSSARNASMDNRGRLIVNTGLLKFVQNDDELAYVVAHELAHFQRRHLLKRQVAGLGQIGLACGTAVLAGAVPIGVGAYIATALLGTLPLARRMENEADADAVTMMKALGFRALAASDFWKRYLQSRSYVKTLPFWARDHPQDNARLEALKKAASMPFPP